MFFKPDTEKTMTDIREKRAYDPVDATDGFRVYVDCLWPRGLSHATFHYDLWDKEVAPSTELREWYHASPADRWEEFARRYRAELDANPALPDFMAQIKGHPVVTLLFSSREPQRNNATVLRAYLLAALNHDK